MRHFGNWIKRDQLHVTCFFISLFSAQHVSDVNTSILRSMRLICWVIAWVLLLWFDAFWCYVVVWLGCCGICTQAEALLLKPAKGLKCIELWFCIFVDWNVFFSIKGRIEGKGLKYTEMWICPSVVCNLYFNIKGRNFNKLLIRQPQENVPYSMFQQDCALLHFHTEVDMITLSFFFGSGVEVLRIDLRDRLMWSRRVFFVGFCEDNIWVRPVPTN